MAPAVLFYAGTTVSTESKPGARVALSSDHSAFLVELSIALHKHAMYPQGHPSLAPAATGVVRRLERLLGERPMVALGVARRQLIVEGVATDPQHPVLRRLAEALHAHHLGAVSFFQHVSADEVAGALMTLAADATRDGPLGLHPERLPAWPHLRLHPLTFDGLALVADRPLPEGEARSFRGAELWIGLARAALAGRTSSGKGSIDSEDTPEVTDDQLPLEPAVMAQAIDSHSRAEAYDQVIVGYLLQIARELRDTNGAETAALRRRTARLIAALNPETLRRLVEMGGNVAQRREFVLDAAHGMAVDAVLEILRAASDVSGQVISHGLVRMLSKLAAHAEQGSDSGRAFADEALRDQVRRLLSGWQLADPNPQSHGALLQRITTSAPDPAGATGSSQSDLPEAPRVVQMCLEANATGALLERAVDRGVRQGKVVSMLQLVAQAPEQGPAARAIRARLRSAPTVAAMLAGNPIDFDGLDALLPDLPLDAYEVLLEGLTGAENRTSRRKLLDRLAQTKAPIGSMIVERLERDDRWYVQRNLLVLLEQSGHVPAGFSAGRWTAHPDARVRHQAIRVQLMMPSERHQALTAALGDADSRLVRLGLAALQADCPAAFVDRVIGIARDSAAPDDLPVLAVRALGAATDPRAVDLLLNLVEGGRTLFGREKIAARTPMVVAALQALRRGWSTHAQAARMLERAETSSDPEIRRAAGPDQR